MLSTFVSSRRVRSIATRVAVLVAVSGAVFVTAATDAFARSTPAMRHLKLLRSTPTSDAVLTQSPDAICLWLSEPTNAALSKISLATASGTPVTLAAITRAAADTAPLIAKLPKAIGAGAYVVTWKAMSKDGHVVKGTIAFSVK